MMHRIVNICLLTLFGMTATVNVWGEEGAAADADGHTSTPQTSNMQRWQEDDRKDNWTWFGMSYESRRSFTESKGAASPGGGGGKGSGAGGPGGRR
jgi:hypothetical protein